jgi:hypothetical protein
MPMPTERDTRRRRRHRHYQLLPTRTLRHRIRNDPILLYYGLELYDSQIPLALPACWWTTSWTVPHTCNAARYIAVPFCFGRQKIANQN